MKKIIMTIMVLFLGANMAQAQCYNQQEMAAEQGLKMHSELMQIGLNCMGILKNPSLYSNYQSFTRNNQATIAGWENTMISYFNRNGGNGETQFHDFRTTMANEISTSAARMRPDVFCHNYVGKLNQAMRMNGADLQRMVQNGRGSRPLCATASR